MTRPELEMIEIVNNGKYQKLKEMLRVTIRSDSTLDKEKSYERAKYAAVLEYMDQRINKVPVGEALTNAAKEI
jgi:hypothetical protein